MLSFHLLHTFPPKYHLLQFPPSRTQTLTHSIPPSIRPNHIQRPTLLLNSLIPKASKQETPNSVNNNSVTSPSKPNPTKLTAVILLCYTHTIIFNLLTKQTLTLIPYPWLLASLHLLTTSAFITFLWLTRLHPFPRISPKFFLAILTPAMFHAAGHIAAYISLSHAPLSFTHTIKSSQPVFSLAISALHAQFHPIHVWLSVIPIAAGCFLAAVTETSVSAAGLYAAVISNVGFVLRNIYWKQSLYEFKKMEGLNLYGWISIVSMVYVIPAAVVMEGKGFRRGIVGAGGWLLIWVMVSGVFCCLCKWSLYGMVEEMGGMRVLKVGKTMRRVVVIVASVMVFGNRVRGVSAVGAVMAILGNLWFVQATETGKKKRVESFTDLGG